MKAKVYMRIARQESRRFPFKVLATTTRNDQPLISGDHWLPTAAFALVLDIPDEMFDQAEQVLAEITVDPKDMVIAAEVQYPEDDDE